MLKLKIIIIEFLIGVSYYIEARQENSFCHQFLQYIVYPIIHILFGMVPYRAVSHKDYSLIQNTLIYGLKDRRVGYSSNVLTQESNASQQLIQFSMNDLLLCQHNQVYIQGGSGLVLDMNRRLAINDYCAEMDDKLSYQDTITKTTKQKVLLLKLGRINRYKKLPAGIMINDRYASNYYHGLYEILIRLLVLEDINSLIPKDVPIIVDEAIMKIPSLKTSFTILTEKIQRPVFVIHQDERLLVGNLYCITPVNLIRHRFDNSESQANYYLFDKEYTVKLKTELLKHKSDKLFPERVFVTRKNTKHRNYNEDEIFEVLKPYGFVKVAPEQLSFEEQMQLFNNVKFVFGGIGAAFTNLLFCSPGCTAVCLRSNTYGFLPPIFSTPACFNGCKVWYFGANNIITGGHSDYEVDIISFQTFINRVLQ